jgi:hypothetical protein
MRDSYYSANQSRGFKLRTRDDSEIGLVDLMVPEEQWIVRFLIADADAWTRRDWHGRCLAAFEMTRIEPSRSCRRATVRLRRLPETFIQMTQD